MSLLDSFKNLFAAKPGGKLPIINVEKRYELIGRSGQGSMSKAWRARDRELGRIVCLKILDKEKTAKFEARFPGLKRPREGVICMALRHPSIVQTFEHGMTTDGEQYIVMELVDGEGLNLMIQTASRQLTGHRVEILGQLADAVAHIHHAGYLHRDICPRNIMVTKDGKVKVIDFGLAIPNRPEFCKPGNRTGTPQYLAPEIIKRTTTDHRVDLFAMGVTAYEVFTGQLPWDDVESMHTLLSHMNNAGRDPLEYRPELGKREVQFLVKAIERNPADRFQTAEEFGEAIRRLGRQ